MHNIPELLDIDLHTLVEPVRAIAMEAGRRILAIYATSFEVNEKPDRSLLTEADLAAHKTIIEGLADLTPTIPVISEEAPAVKLAERRQWEWLWLVDPLDGTREFVNRSDEFSVNIALIHRHEAVFGLILMPVSGICYLACRGGGAFKLLPDCQPEAIHTRRCNDHMIRVVSSRRSYKGRLLQAYLAGLGRYDYVSAGSALKSCLVAEGKADLYPRFGPSGEWDTAAAQVIVEQAGGGLVDSDMRALRYNARPILINPDFFAFGDPSHDWSQYLLRLNS